MPIPPICPYPMPTRDEVPATPVSWRPDRGRAAVLVHDMQDYFLRAFTANASPLAELIANTAAVLVAARTAGVPVLYTAQPGGMSRRQRGLLHDFWGPGMGTDEADRRIAGQLAPRPGEAVLTKWRYSAFHRTGMARALRSHHRDQLIICGVYAHVGCLMTACDAFTHDIETFLVADALGDFSRDDHLMALRYAAGRCAVPVCAHEVVAALGGQVDTSPIASAAGGGTR